jgi:probable F420-dependent oxidoreductase
MRFGIGQFTLQIPPWDNRDHAELYHDTLEVARLADQLGVDSFWLAEHHGASDGYNPSLLPFLSAVAARTEMLEIGTAVLLAPLHHPLRIAEDAAVVDNISNGRLTLGLGLGWVPDEYRMFGASMQARGRKMAEFVEVLRKAWTGETFSYEGQAYRLEDVRVTPRPAQEPPPIYLGGMAPAALARAARLGDGYFPPSTAGLDDAVARAEAILDERDRIGASGPFGYGMFVPVGLGSDAEDGWRRIRDGLLHVRGSYALWGSGTRDVSGARDFAAQFEEQVRAGAVCGTPEEVVAQLRPVVETLDAMFEDCFFSAILAPPGTPRYPALQSVELYARDVIRALR